MPRGSRHYVPGYWHLTRPTANSGARARGAAQPFGGGSASVTPAALTATLRPVKTMLQLQAPKTLLFEGKQTQSQALGMVRPLCWTVVSGQR